MGTVQVPVSGGKAFTLIDEADADRVLCHKWHLSSINIHTAYVQHEFSMSGKRRIVKLHRFILGVDGKTICVDHINGDRLDNRRENLRVCTAGENSRNRVRALGKEAIRGVRKRSTGKFSATITYNYKRYHIGNFETQYDASVAYAFASTLLHGEFGSLPGHEKFLNERETVE